MIDYERLTKWYGNTNIKTILYASVDLKEALVKHDYKNIVASLSMIEAIVQRYVEFYDIANLVKENANEINESDYQHIIDRYSPSREKMREARFDNE